MAASPVSKGRKHTPALEEELLRPRIDPDEVLEDLEVKPDDDSRRRSALADVLSPAGTREDDDRDRSGFVKPHRFQHT
jgi:hypothetical protein